MSEVISYSNLQFLKDYWSFIKEYKAPFTFWVIIRTAASAMNLVPVLIIGLIVDFFTKYNQGDSLYQFYGLLALLAINEILRCLLRLISKYRLAIIAMHSKTKARIRGFDKLMEFDLAWHEKETTGKKLTRINTGAQKISDGQNFLRQTGIDLIINIGAVTIIFAALSWKYLLIALIYCTLHMINEVYHNEKQAILSQLSNKSKEKAAGFLVESSSNILTAKTLGLRNSLLKKSSRLEKENLEINIKAKKIGNYKWRWLQIIGAINWIGFLLVLGFDVIAGVVSVGSIVIYSGYFTRLSSGLKEVTKNADGLIEIKYGIQRMMEIFNQVPNIVEDPDAKPFPKRFSALNVKDVHFKYKQKEVLKGISFHIKKGEKVGLVGRSGSGKSTLFKLLMGLYHPTEGSICINSTSLKKIKHASLTEHMSVALQDTELFNITLKENLGMVSTKATTKDIFNAIRIAQLTDVVNKLPDKEKTLIGEKGFKLSGGERQRVGIARAILKDADIILLDEATSNLDSKTEELIQKGLKKELKNKTVIMTAHRLSTLKDVDRIIVFQSGKIVEQGKYNKLLKNKGLFYKLHKLQSKKK